MDKIKKRYIEAFKIPIKLLGSSEFTNSIIISMSIVWILWHYKILP